MGRGPARDHSARRKAARLSGLSRQRFRCFGHQRLLGGLMTAFMGRQSRMRTLTELLSIGRPLFDTRSNQRIIFFHSSVCDRSAQLDVRGQRPASDELKQFFEHRHGQKCAQILSSLYPHDSPHFQMTPKASAKTGSSARIVANRSINGSKRNSGMVGINS